MPPVEATGLAKSIFVQRSGLQARRGEHPGVMFAERSWICFDFGFGWWCCGKNLEFQGFALTSAIFSERGDHFLGLTNNFPMFSDVRRPEKIGMSMGESAWIKSSEVRKMTMNLKNPKP